MQTLIVHRLLCTHCSACSTKGSIILRGGCNPIDLATPSQVELRSINHIKLISFSDHEVAYTYALTFAVFVDQ